MKKHIFLSCLFLTLIISVCSFLEFDFANIGMGISVPVVKLKRYFNNSNKEGDVASVVSDMAVSLIDGIYSDSLSSEDTAEYCNILENENMRTLVSDMHDEKYQYFALGSEAEKKCYKLVEDALFHISSQPNTNGVYFVKRIQIPNENLTQQQIKNVIYAVESDNPYAFWISDVFSYAYVKESTVLELRSVMSAPDCIKSCENLNHVIDKVMSNIKDYEEKVEAYGKSKLSDFEKELYIHDFIIGRCDYDNKADSLNESYSVFTAYGALVEKKAVCEGYSKAIKILLNKNSIPCRLVTGNSENILHMWNLVKLGGEWYHLDATWDESDKLIKYDYFNVTDSIINRDHSICYSNFGNSSIPGCNSLKENYFSVRAKKIGNLDVTSDEKMISALVRAVNNNDNTIAIMIEENLDYKDTINKMFYASPYKFLYYIKEADKRLDLSCQIDYTNVQFSLCENMRSAVVKFSLK